ncbi:MAG: hypothetical protein ACI4TR_02925, partial [Bacteroidaceae bacterium]
TKRIFFYILFLTKKLRGRNSFFVNFAVRNVGKALWQCRITYRKERIFGKMRPLVTYINKVVVVCDTTAKVVMGG